MRVDLGWLRGMTDGRALLSEMLEGESRQYA